ncbi:hypothetical protein AB0M28_16910 [Streptomyces sp. NPDC051940]|uniref:hypothetical protein n=1 Tax=Streptomyces sp. NPDC051940 TaxID=3155675 RepID=UPI00342E4056
MAEKPLAWLDEEAAELLLRGENVLPASGSARDQADADQLAAFIEVLAATGRPGRPDGPGQEAAVAAFRESRTSRRRSHGVLFELTRRLRPARAAVAVALLACTAGGVAVASTAGVLDPFSDPSAPPSASASAEPDASVSSAGTPEPGGSASAGGDGGARSGDGDGTGDGKAKGKDTGKDAGEGQTKVTDAQLDADCRAYTSATSSGGKADKATMSRLATAAGGSGKVAAYCADRLGQGAQGSDATTPEPAQSTPDSEQPSTDGGTGVTAEDTVRSDSATEAAAR